MSIKQIPELYMGGRPHLNAAIEQRIAIYRRRVKLRLLLREVRTVSKMRVALHLALSRP